MAVTQYIGSRYVPLFADPIDWDITRAYEPLTIVYYQGNSYTSKQSVPTGIDVTNTTYWAITGNYNAQVEQYRREVQTFDGRITANAQAIADEVTARMAEDTAIRALITTLNTDLESEESAREAADTQIRTDFAAADTQIRTDFAAADTQIRTDFAAADAQIRTDFAAADTALANRITQTEHMGRVCILIGDSYGEGYTPDGSVDGWCKRAAENLAIAGITAKYKYRGGSSLGNDYFLNDLQEVVEGMTDAEKVRCDTVIICGGYNDRVSSETDLNSGARKIASYVGTNLPNAKCILSFVGKCVTGRTTGAHANVTMESVYTAWRKWSSAAGTYGLGFDDGAIGTLCNDEFFASDFVHPNASGLTQIAKRITSLICKGAITDSTKQFVIRANAWSDYTDTTVHNPQQLLGCLDNRGILNGLMFNAAASPMQMFDFTAPKQITFNPTNQVNLAYLRSACTTGLYYSTTCNALWHDTTGQGYVLIPGRFIINNDGRVAIACLDGATNNYRSLTVDSVQIILSNTFTFF